MVVVVVTAASEVVEDAEVVAGVAIFGIVALAVVDVTDATGRVVFTDGFWTPDVVKTSKSVVWK